MPTVAPSYDYSTGKLSIANGDNVVVGSGLGVTGWGGSVARRGDTIIFDYGGANEKISVVLNPIDLTHLEVPRYTGPDLVNVDYVIYWISPTRVAGAEAVEDITRLVNFLNSAGIFVYVDPGDSVPDPSIGEEGQQALQPSTGKIWVRTSGVWTFVGVFKGFSPKGEFDGAVTYGIGDVVSDTIGGASYISKVDENIGHTPSTSPDQWMLNAHGLPGPSGATIIIANAAPVTTYPLNTLWIDGDSADLDVYQLNATPAWVDTGMNLKGLKGDTSTITVLATNTLAPGSSAAVIDTGTPTDAEFTFNIPRGDVGPQGQGIQPNASGTLANRSTHDGAAQGYIYLSTDEVPMKIYVKNSATSGDWSAGAPVGGDMIKADNLAGLASPSAAVANLGILDPIVASIVFGA